MHYLYLRAITHSLSILHRQLLLVRFLLFLDSFLHLRDLLLKGLQQRLLTFHLFLDLFKIIIILNPFQVI